MSAYQQVYEAKRGHAAGDSDVEKQASQLASDVKYKAKGKVKEGASEEEKKKVFMQILGSSPAPNAVKAMARQKLLGEEVVQEMRFNDGKEGTKKRLKALEKKRGMKMPNHPQFKDDDVKEGKMPEGLKKYLDKKQGKKEDKEEVKEGSSYGITRGSGKPSGQMAAFGKAPRMQKGAMAYDGPNKERSEAADRVIAKTKAKRAKMKKEEVELGEMKMKMKVKPKNPKDMSKGVGQAAPVDYRTLAQSHVPVGNPVSLFLIISPNSTSSFFIFARFAFVFAITLSATSLLSLFWPS